MSSPTLMSTAESAQRHYDKENLFHLGRLAAVAFLKQQLNHQHLELPNVQIVVEGLQIALVGRVADKDTQDTIVTTLFVQESVASVSSQGVSTGIECAPTHPHGLVYIVEEGDDLSTVARKIYRGDSRGYVELYNANRDTLGGLGNIYPGQVLSVPSLADVKEAL